MNDYKILPLNSAEQQWVDTEVQNFLALRDTLFPDLKSNSITPENLDLVFKTSYESKTADPNYANSIINAVGMAFGQLLIDQVDAQWCAISDENGCEIAIVKYYPNGGESIVCPTNFVAKRWESGTTEFFVETIPQIRANLDNPDLIAPQARPTPSGLWATIKRKLGL
jgi:hypothetical protein